jgi:hypothetical protein
MAPTRPSELAAMRLRRITRRTPVTSRSTRRCASAFFTCTMKTGYSASRWKLPSEVDGATRVLPSSCPL